LLALSRRKSAARAQLCAPRDSAGILPDWPAELGGGRAELWGRLVMALELAGGGSCVAPLPPDSIGLDGGQQV
jgi:hypothetical protein